MEINITQKMEWLSARCNIQESDKEYIEFLLKETVIEVANKLNEKKPINLNKKFNYKVRNKSTGEFASTNNGKATWQRASAVLDILKGKTGYNNITKQTQPNWEVVLFTLDDPLTMSSADFLEHYREAEEAKLEKRRQKERDRQEQIELYHKERELETLRNLKQKYPNA